MDLQDRSAGIRRKEVEGERRIVTILFTDVKGSTSFAEGLDPEEWAEIMNAAFEYLIKPVHRYEGKVARLMGDGILAFFGAPVAHEDDPQRAILAALEMLSSIQPFREQLQTEYGMDFDLRVGINTGPVVVGEIGSEQAGEYTAMGDAVNLASRLEQTAAPGTVQVSAETYRLASPFFDFEPLGNVEVRGKLEPVQVYRALGVKARPGRARGIPGLDSPLVGRDREFASLGRALKDLRLGRGALLALVGEAGLGKSRLIEELKLLSMSASADPPSAQVEGARGMDGSEDAPPPLWVEARGISYDTARPYGLFQQHFRQAPGVSEDDSNEVIRQRLATSFTNLDEATRSAILRASEALLALRAPQPDSKLEGEALRRELFASLLELWRCLAERSPVVLVFDDLHWADPASVDLLLHLFQLCDQVPILFLCAFRPVHRSAGWRVKTTGETEYPHRYQEISLAPLSEGESGDLVDRLLAVSALPPALRARVMHKSEGNPFFLEELVRTLIEAGVIRREHSTGNWVADQSAADESIDLPENLHALLQARIDRLETAPRQALQLASVIGRSFSYPLLEAIAGEIPDLDRQLAELERAGLLYEVKRIPEREYLFRHELTRDAAYYSILRRQRRAYHRAVGETLERSLAGRSPEKLDAEAHRLVTHFDEARDYPRVLEYAARAGDHAYRLHASQEAIQHYRRALELALRLEAPASQRDHLYTRLGRSLELSGRYDQALALYKDWCTLARSRQEAPSQVEALLAQATVHAIPSSEIAPQAGRSLALEALGMSRELADQRSEARALWVLMLIEFFSGGDVSLAASYGEAGLKITRQLDLREERAYILNDISRPYFVLGRLQEARIQLEEAVQLWRELNNLPMLADSLGTIGEFTFTQGQFDQTDQLVEQGLEIGRKIGSPWAQAYPLILSSLVSLERGLIDQGLATLEEAASLADQGNFLIGMVAIRVTRFYFFSLLGHREAAQALYPQIEAHFSRLDDAQVHLTLLKTFQAYFIGEVTQAAALIQEIESTILNSDLDIYYGPLAYQLAVDVALANHQPQRALELIAVRLRRFEISGATLYLPDLLRQRAKAYLQLGQTDQAYHDLLEGRAEALRQGSRRSLWPILADLASWEARPSAEFRRELDEVLEFLLAHIQEPGLRAAFLELPDVKPFIE